MLPIGESRRSVTGPKKNVGVTHVTERPFSSTGVYIVFGLALKRSQGRAEPRARRTAPPEGAETALSQPQVRSETKPGGVWLR
jgi:hypothetical protein